MLCSFFHSFLHHDVGMSFILTLYIWRCTVLLVCMHGGNERIKLSVLVIRDFSMDGVERVV